MEISNNIIREKIEERQAFPQKLLDSLKARLFILEVYANKLGCKVEKPADNEVLESQHPNDKPFGCLYCDFETTSSDLLSQHIVIHLVDESSDSSSHPNNGADSPQPRINYLGKKLYVCTECDYMTPNSCDLVVHHRTHTGERPFPCTYCTYRASLQSTLDVHYRTHTGEKPFTCTFCPFRTSQASNLSRHMQIHIQDLTCASCSYKTRFHRNMKAHIRYKHRADNPPVLVNLKPPKVKSQPYACPFCEYKTFEYLPFIQHKRIHSAEVDTPYACTYCDFRSADIVSLDVHKQTHAAATFFSDLY